MSAKRNADLKSAFQALRVNQPLRLPKEGPSLVPPSEVTGKEVPQNGAPQSNPTQKEAARNESPRNEASGTLAENHKLTATRGRRSEAAQIEQPYDEPPQREAAQSELSKNEAAKNGGAAKQVARNQVPQSELPPIEYADEPMESVSGFFKLSHGVFSDPSLRNLSGDCFRLFLWLSARAWRYPTSPGVIRASVRFMEEQTGMSHATVSRALKVLKDLSLVTLLETDFKRGNVWKISPTALTGRGPDNPTEPGDRLPRIKKPQNEAAQNRLEAASKKESSSLNLRGEPPQKAHNIKKYKNLRNLSQRSATKRLCVSPDVQLPEESFDEESRKVACELFERELTVDERTNFLTSYSAKEFPHGFFPPPLVLASMAAYAWFCDRNSSTTYSQAV